MASITQGESYRVWQNLSSETWETLYNRLYEDYNNSGKLLTDKTLEYQILQFTRNLIETDGASFPASWEQFHSFLNDHLKNY